MVMLPAGFGNCALCGRLLVVDSHNANGRCTTDCGGSVAGVQHPPLGPETARVLAAAREQAERWRGALDLMARWPEEDR